MHLVRKSHHNRQVFSPFTSLTNLPSTPYTVNIAISIISYLVSFMFLKSYFYYLKSIEF